MIAPILGAHHVEQVAGQAMDFVISWVDGFDPDCRSELSRYREPEIDGTHEARFRDWGLLRRHRHRLEPRCPQTPPLVLWLGRRLHTRPTAFDI